MRIILEETDKNRRSGLLLALAAASIKIFFKQKIETGESVSIAGKKISTLAELDAIDQDFFRSAVQFLLFGTILVACSYLAYILLLSQRVV